MADDPTTTSRREEAATAEEIIADDDLCPICALLIYAPVRTQCAHYLCSSCMAQWALANNRLEFTDSPLNLNLGAFDSRYDAAHDLETSCPMCRTQTASTPDATLARVLEAKYPATYAARRIEEDVYRAGIAAEGIMILFGNRHKLDLGEEGEDEYGNMHDWTFFVRTSRPEVVREVRVALHPTFRPPAVTIREPPFEVRRLGWGTFTIEATVVLEKGFMWVGGEGSEDTLNDEGLKLQWDLNFAHEESVGRHIARVRQVGPESVARRTRGAARRAQMNA